MIQLKRISDEIFVAVPSIVYLGGEEAEFLKQQAAQSPRKRARICAHKTNEDGLHEMLIAIAAGSYIHPHKHIAKSESFHIVEGLVDVIIFDDQGALFDVIKLGEFGSGRSYYYRLSDSMFHTLVIRSEMLVMHEVTNGPFNKEQTILAPFAPEEGAGEAVREYMGRISQMGESFKRRMSE
ncbi:MAG: cupin fold metalloprotein, WbuC family [Sideroxydans sp.]|nr:cupin fold metalloprotein, WbuC family [Sideroxydans sp.]